MYANASAAFDAPTVESIAATMDEFQERGRRIDDDMASALRAHIDRSAVPFPVWCERLGVRADELAGILGGTVRPISARFYDRVRLVFDVYPSGAE